MILPRISQRLFPLFLHAQFLCHQANQLIDDSFWQAGADPDALLIGVSFVASDTILMNTIHISHLNKRESSEIAKGLVVVTYPSRGSGKAPK